MRTGNKRIFRLVRRFRDVGKYRDSILVGIGLVYLLGYLVWFIIAWKQGLGPVPILDAQYFVAGLPVLFMLTVFSLILSVLAWLLLTFWPAWLQRIDDRQIRILNVIFKIAPSVAFLAMLAVGDAVVRSGTSLRLLAIAFWGFYLIILSLWVLSSECNGEATKRREPSRPLTALDAMIQKYTRATVITGVVGTPAFLFAAGCFFYYTDVIYMTIPQEFGGAKPRMAQLNLVRDSVSPEMVQLLAGKPVIDPNERVVSSKRIAVLFAGNDRLVINPDPNDLNSVDRVEIARDVVKAIRWYRPGKAVGNRTSSSRAKLKADGKR